MTSSEPVGSAGDLGEPGSRGMSGTGTRSPGRGRGLRTGPLLDSVSEIACELLGVSRAGVWALEAEGARLRRVHLYDHTTGSHRPGPGLLERDRFPAYFSALEESDRTLTVSDAATDGRLGDLYEVYARPLGIRAWIDTPIRSEEGIVGMLRLEGVDEIREWTDRERQVALALGSLLARSGILPAPEESRRTAGERNPGGGSPGAEAHRPDAKQLVDQLPAALVLTDREGAIVRCNAAFVEMLGYDSSSELMGRPIRHVHASDQERRELREELDRKGRVTSRGYRARARDGSRLWLLESAVRLDEETAAVFGEAEEGFVLSAITDVTRLKLRQTRLEEQAYRDPLTGLANRRFLRETMLQTLALAERHGRQLAVAYLDLSDFKAINDRYGHEVGDEVLRVAGQRIVEGVRDSDVVARIGGDEFVILFAEVEGGEGAQEVSRRMLERFRRPVRVHGLELEVRADVGIALYPDHGRDVDQLLRNADVAMYRAKRADGDRVRTYRAEDGAASTRGAERDREAARQTSFGPSRRPSGREASAAPVRTPLTEEGVREALASGRLTLHYQPVYRLSSGATVGAEALLRWDHPQAGMLPAAEFVPLVDDPDLLRDLDRWALEAAVDQLARWRDERSPFFLSVNVDPRSLDRVPLFLDSLFGRTGVDPSRLVLEVVIDAPSGDVGGLAEKLSYLEGTGCPIALDLGPDPGRLAPFLQNVPSDMIKLETSCVTGEPRESPIAELFVDGTGGREPEMLVKRVETEEQYRAVREQSVTLGQGHFWSRAVPPDDLRVA